MQDQFNEAFEEGYSVGFTACRETAWFTIIMASAFSLAAGILAGMAFVDFVF